MEALIGITTKDYTIIAADASTRIFVFVCFCVSFVKSETGVLSSVFTTGAARSIVVFKTDEDKILKLDNRKILAATG